MKYMQRKVIYMEARSLRFSTFFLLYLCLGSGTSVAEKRLSEYIWQNKLQDDQENRRFFPSFAFFAQRDTTPGSVPIVNPTTPGTSTPIVDTPSPPAPIFTTPTPTSPSTNPTPPITNPTSPTTNPTPPITNPTPPITNPTPNTTPTASGGAWCVASPTASQTTLQVALDYACGFGGADCSAIQPGGRCYNPNTVKDHASYAFNDYYQKNPSPTSCNFGGAAQLTNTDPSSGNCHYASASTSSTSNSPPAVPSPFVPSPVTPSPFNPTPTTMVPGGPTVYGASGPTGLPSSAISLDSSTWILIVSLSGSFLTANYLKLM